MFAKKITDHIEKAKSRLVEQDKESNNIVKFQNALIGKWQELENLLWDVFAEKNILTAKYKSLDYLGAIVNESRNYRDDEEYRRAIINKIIQNNSTGTPEELIVLVSFLVADITKIYFREIKQNSFLIEINYDLTINQVSSLKEMIILAKPICINFAGLVIIPTNAIIFDEMRNIKYDYTVGRTGILLNTNNTVETTLEVIDYKAININLPGLSDWASDTDFTENGNLTDLME
jgi:hypothetical protein